jgi:hypothetical protein
MLATDYWLLFLKHFPKLLYASSDAGLGYLASFGGDGQLGRDLVRSAFGYDVADRVGRGWFLGLFVHNLNCGFGDAPSMTVGLLTRLPA